MNGLLYESGTAIEDFREIDLPSAALALRPLRQRIYGLLLHERPRRSHEPVVVTEWCVHGEDSLEWPALVEPVNIQGRECLQLIFLYWGYDPVWVLGSSIVCFPSSYTKDYLRFWSLEVS
jgi:hypothetical protein